MREGNLFLADLWVGKCTLTQPLDKKISLSFRVGKNVVQTPAGKYIEDGVINFDTTLHLNTDQSALDTQRCSLTLLVPGVGSQFSVVGIVLIALPKGHQPISRKFKLTQCLDKNAQIELSLRFSPLQTMNVSEIRNSSIMSVQSPTSGLSGLSAKGSIMEMKQFDKKVISPPTLFLESSGLEKQSRHLLPPKPRSSREISSSHKHSSTYTLSAKNDEPTPDYQNECKCLKQLLRLQMRKNQSANKIVSQLISTLQKLSQSTVQVTNQLEQTFLLDNLDHSVQHDADQNDRINYLEEQLKELKLQNLRIMEKYEKMRRSKTDQYIRQEDPKINIRGNRSPDLNESRNTAKDISRRLSDAERAINEANRKIQKMKSELASLQNELISKEEELQRFKKKMRVETKFSSLKCIDPQKSQTPSGTIRTLIDKGVAERKEMFKLLLRSFKQDTDITTEALLVKIKGKIEKSFANLSSKRLTKESVLQEKGQLMKAIQEAITNQAS